MEPTPTPQPRPLMVKGLFFFFALIALLSIYYFMTKNTINVGDAVFAEWSTKSWYAGTIDDTCEAGYHVVFTDGGDKCVSEQQIILDRTQKRVSPGDKVIAQWTGDAYYDAEVVSRIGDNVKVKYYDGVEYEVLSTQVRLDPRT